MKKVMFLAIALLIFYSCNSHNRATSDPWSSHNNEKDFAPIPKDSIPTQKTETQTIYVQNIDTDRIVANLINEINSNIKNYKVFYSEDVDSFLVKVIIYNNDLSNYSQCKKYNDLKRAVVSFQKKFFPQARRVYYEHTKQVLWEKNVDVSLYGKTIIFTGAIFADNANKKDMYEGVKNTLTSLRFKGVWFRWYADDDGAGWGLYSLKDEDLIKLKYDKQELENYIKDYLK